MPVVRCQLDGKPGFKWGPLGKCYTYVSGDEASRRRAQAQANAQGVAARAGGYTGKETCMTCGTQDTALAISFFQEPKKCCFDSMVPWTVYGEAQKLKCVNCGNVLSSIRVEKGSFIADDYRNVCAYLLRKQVFGTRDDADKWLRNNSFVRRYNAARQQVVEIDVVRETETAWAVISRPYDWFARGTLKAMWTSIGIIVVTGNLREDVDDRIPTEAELSATANFVERI